MAAHCHSGLEPESSLPLGVKLDSRFRGNDSRRAYSEVINMSMSLYAGPL